MVFITDPLQHMLSSLSDFNYIPYGAYRIAMKLRYIQKKTRLLHVTTDMWRTVVEEHCLENPNLVLQPAEISSVVTSLLRAVSQEVGDSLMMNEDECARLMLSWLSILYPQPALTALQLNVPIILLSNSEPIAKHRLLFEMTRMSGYQLTHKQLSHMLHLSSYLLISCGENTSLVSETSQCVAQRCFTYNNIPLHSGITLDLYEQWLLSEPEYLAWIPALYRLNVSENMKHEVRCGACKCHPILGLRYRCLKCVNLDLCQECFLKGEVYKNHDVTHPLKEYVKQGGRSESIKDLTSLVKTYFKPKSYKASSRAPSEGAPKSVMSHYESADYETIATEEWFARKGRLPLQTPLQYTSCPTLHVADQNRMVLLQQQNDLLTAQVDRLQKEVIVMSSPPPYHPQSEVMTLNQSSHYEVMSEPERAPSPTKLPSFPTRPLSPLQTIAEIADTFSTDIGLYSGDDRERHPVICGAGKIGFAMDSFLADMFHKTPPPKPKRTSPNLSKGSSTPPSSRTSTPSNSGIDLHLAFDPQNKTKPAHLVQPTKQKTEEKDKKICSSTPKTSRKGMLDISFTCSSVKDDEIGTSGLRKNGGREVQNGRRGAQCTAGRSLEKEKLRRMSPGQSNSNSVVRRHSEGNTHEQTDIHSLADSSITRSIRRVYQPPPLLLTAAHSEVEICGRGAERESLGRSRISRNYRGSMDQISFNADGAYSEFNYSYYSNSHRTLASKSVV
ncbi:hypothetical protein ACHWQZ_G014014 [Mnemiopsis leidyi]